MVNIHINNTTIKLSGEKPPQSSTFREYEFRKLANSSPDTILLKAFQGDLGKQVIVWGETPFKMMGYLRKYLVEIYAAGGIVQNPSEEILYIFRNGKWDFPKGKPEKSESREQTAKREVEEETGVSGLTIISALPTTYHIYPLSNGGFVLKSCYWYHMKCKNFATLKVQKEEGIETAKWIKMPVPQDIIDGAFLSIRELTGYFQENYLRLPEGGRLS